MLSILKKYIRITTIEEDFSYQIARSLEVVNWNKGKKDYQPLECLEEFKAMKAFGMYKLWLRIKV